MTQFKVVPMFFAAMLLAGILWTIMAWNGVLHGRIGAFTMIAVSSFCLFHEWSDWRKEKKRADKTGTESNFDRICYSIYLMTVATLVLYLLGSGQTVIAVASASVGAVLAVVIGVLRLERLVGGNATIPVAG